MIVIASIKPYLELNKERLDGLLNKKLIRHENICGTQSFSQEFIIGAKAFKCYDPTQTLRRLTLKQRNNLHFVESGFLEVCF